MINTARRCLKEKLITEKSFAQYTVSVNNLQDDKVPEKDAGRGAPESFTESAPRPAQFSF